VGWNVAGVDWPVGRTGADVEAAIVDGATAHGDGCVVLLHTWPDATEAAIPGAVRRLRAAGAELVRIDELPIGRLPETDVPDAVVVPPSPA
jgi:hypothetical protein